MPMLFPIPKKFAEKQIDEFIAQVLNHFKNSPKDKFLFDFTNVEYMDNQELLVLSGIFKMFYASKVDFEVRFFPLGVPINQVHERVQKQIIQIWQVWKIYDIIDDQQYKKYFGIDGNTIARLQEELQYYPKNSEIYNRYGVTPFVTLEYLNNYEPSIVNELIIPIYNLNEATVKILELNHCAHPFTSHALSQIVTEELYLNFLDHSSPCSFKGLVDFAFMSIAFQEKLSEDKFTAEEIQKLKSLNFDSERVAESRNFYMDDKTRQFKNVSYVQFSFLDFGAGIAHTLKEEYLKHHVPVSEKNLDNEILKYAFHYDSSRHPLRPDNGAMFTRGLFDALVIVRRYNGMMTVRSNYGKIIYNFSAGDQFNIEAAYIKNKGNSYFPGTLITITIPAFPDVKKINVAAIKPETSFIKVKWRFR